MAQAHVLGLPRIGGQRELKFAVEAFWRGEMTVQALQDTGRCIRAANRAAQREVGLDWTTVGDFHWYDQVLSTLALVGGLPERFGVASAALTLADYFAAARGNAQQSAMEMTKWFDTNYHYLVPEYSPHTRFGAGTEWLFEEVAEALVEGANVKPVLLGPLSLLYLGKEKGGLTDRLSLLPELLTQYERVLARLKAQGVTWVQIDEPILALDLPELWRDAFAPVYQRLALIAPSLLLATYFGDVSEHAALLAALPIAGVHLDGVRAPKQLETFAAQWPQDKVLSAGGRRWTQRLALRSGACPRAADVVGANARGPSVGGVELLADALPGRSGERGAPGQGSAHVARVCRAEAGGGGAAAPFARHR